MARPPVSPCPLSCCTLMPLSRALTTGQSKAVRTRRGQSIEAPSVSIAGVLLSFSIFVRKKSKPRERGGSEHFPPEYISKRRQISNVYKEGGDFALRRFFKNNNPNRVLEPRSRHAPEDQVIDSFMGFMVEGAHHAFQGDNPICLLVLKERAWTGSGALSRNRYASASQELVGWVLHEVEICSGVAGSWSCRRWKVSCVTEVVRCVGVPRRSDHIGEVLRRWRSNPTWTVASIQWGWLEVRDITDENLCPSSAGASGDGACGCRFPPSRRRGGRSSSAQCTPLPDSLYLLVQLLCIIRISASPESDKRNLFALRNAIPQGKGFLHDWFDPKTPPCSWSGITCAGDAVVAIDLSHVPLYVPFPSCIGTFQLLVRLKVSGCQFNGELPEVVGNLRQLQYLDLSNNQLAGPLPVSLFDLKMLKELVLDKNCLSGQLSPAIGQLQHLTKLSMSMNSISGSLPPELGTLQNLEFLNLNRNTFSGSLPAAFSNLTRLSYLAASNNSLTGSIFPGIGTLVNLRRLVLSSNGLTGPIPEEIGQLENLEVINLMNNGFTESIPEEIGHLKRLKVLKLSNCKFNGAIPRSIGGLESLMTLDISGNNFTAELPTSVGELSNLIKLLAVRAGLTGAIPKELGNCKKITVIDLSFNHFTGSIPEELAELEAIISFKAEGNRLSGHIPDWLQNWGNIKSISLVNNMFSGPLPLLPLQHLVEFSAGKNLLSGPIPAGVCQAISLRSLNLYSNNLTGSIKETFKGCRNLTILSLQVNQLCSEIPEYLAELPLVSLDLTQNNFTGSLPDKFWESSTVQELYLSDNNLTGMIPESIAELSHLKILRIDNNYLEGPIPRSVGTLKSLITLSLRCNMLSGNIPVELFNCTNLVTLDLSYNSLTGHIPREISRLTLLNSLALSNNQLSGTIPSEICVGFSHASHVDLRFYQHQRLLDLSYNQLTGQIPTTIKDCAVVAELYLQGNLLNGTIPAELGELMGLATIDLSFNALSLLCNHHLSRLDVSNNNLSGEILFSCPDGDEGSASALNTFNASNNHFSGSLDVSISNFTGLTSLDIHSNSLNGSLPSAVCNVTTLNYLDLSSNDFSGTIPCGICDMFNLVFANFSGNHIVGTYNLADCAANNINHKAAHPSYQVSLAAIVCGITIIIILLVLLGVYLRRRLLKRRSSWALVPASKTMVTSEETLRSKLLGKKSREPLSINLATFEHSLMRVAADDILKATENFSNLHIIGDGGFGTVYRAALFGGRQVAVKRLHGGHQLQDNREFQAEIETIGKVKHPNLVPLLGYCASGDERFLIYEYMEHGCLEAWLRKNRTDAAYSLGWPDRLKICLGSAKGLAFLHHGFVPHIIHRDMKSSNILLDWDLEPRVSDFGLARIISACETHVSTNLAGTLGYIPPEYGLSMRCTARGDVYSFGVSPIPSSYRLTPTQPGPPREGGVRSLPPTGFGRVQAADAARAHHHPGCTADDPWARPTMLEVVKGLKATQMMESTPPATTTLSRAGLRW
ncbi:Leucine-rich repeat receptor protein kinase EXS [Triticum urartu]|uniref:Leucine-rich repeat receptor protein kinase EXS n=1 Tax=Triticum urartu TaxID=4572 RepID=M8A6S9_TRIUA|nr:Leucine-rich repeat receptor protein kinase EXS [Triticum urartu]